MLLHGTRHGGYFVVVLLLGQGSGGPLVCAFLKNGNHRLGIDPIGGSEQSLGFIRIAGLFGCAGLFG